MRFPVAAATFTTAIAFSSAAFAADIYTPPPAAPVAPLTPISVYNWSGFYAGVNAGYGWGDVGVGGEITSIILGEESAGFFGLDAGAEVFPGDDAFDFILEDSVLFGGGTRSFDADGWLAGGQIGANWQVNNLVLGIEADIQASGIDGTYVTNEVFEDDFDYEGEINADLDWFGTLRGRLGVAFDRILIYGTGGLAYGGMNVNGQVTEFGDGGDRVFVDRDGDDQTHVGWTVGAGVEGAITENLTAKIEYLYVDLGEEDYELRFEDENDDAFNTRLSSDFDAHIIRAGLNYRFNLY